VSWWKWKVSKRISNKIRKAWWVNDKVLRTSWDEFWIWKECEALGNENQKTKWALHRSGNQNCRTYWIEWWERNGNIESGRIK